MEKDDSKIIIYRDEDPEFYHLVDKIEKTAYGSLLFESNEIKEIKTKHKKPYLVVTVEKSNLITK
ncbi:MAG TPA: hypothetical protein ENL09_05790 [Bacteroidetes bacterium]|nr:hypothetical protein [Bacteroidota bacterium]